MFKLLNQVYMPREKELLVKTTDILKKVTDKCDFYYADVNKTVDSAKVIHNGLKDE